MRNFWEEEAEKYLKMKLYQKKTVAPKESNLYICRRAYLIMQSTNSSGKKTLHRCQDTADIHCARGVGRGAVVIGCSQGRNLGRAPPPAFQTLS